MTLPRRFRLTTATQFRTVFRHPVVSSDACFRVLARPNGEDDSRLGLAVSRKVDRRAVVRNRLKRIIRESFRHHYAAPDAPVAADFVVLPQRAAVSISNRQLREKLERHWASLDRRLIRVPLRDGATPQPETDRT